MPSANVTDAIDNLTTAILAGDLIFAIATVFFLTAIFAILAAWLTATMFRSQNMMLGFPSAIFWALTGACFYLVPSAVDPMPDIEWVTGWWNWLGFACFGMVIFCVTAMYALRTKKEDTRAGEEYIDEGPDDTRYIDEDSKGNLLPDGAEAIVEDGPRSRADRRRSSKGRGKKPNYGEFR